LTGIRYGCAALLVAATVCWLGAAPSHARGPAVRISAPAALVMGKACRVGVTVGDGVRGTALLQERSAGRWRTVSTARLRRRSVTLRCPTVDRVGRTRRFRALVRRNGRTIARSRTVSTRVVPAPPATPPQVPVPGSPPKPPAPAPGTPGAPAPALLDPAQFGVEGTGGAPSPAALALLGNQSVVLDADGEADIRAGRIDPRIIAVLTKVAETHRITVSAMCSDHPKFTSGASVSNHYFGRGVDIAAVDGSPVSVGNTAALAVTSGLSSLDASYRPDEVGSPWVFSRPGYFTDADSQDKIHVAFKHPIDPAWTPPA
jgi:hypothetical protein